MTAQRLAVMTREWLRATAGYVERNITQWINNTSMYIRGGKPLRRSAVQRAWLDLHSIYCTIQDPDGNGIIGGSKRTLTKILLAGMQAHEAGLGDSVKLTGAQSVAGHKTWTSIGTFGDTEVSGDHAWHVKR